MRSRRSILPLAAALAVALLGGRWVARGYALQVPRQDAPIAAPAVIDGLPTNVLVIIADDVGVDKLRAYGEGEEVPDTPHLDALAARGVRFDRAYAHPSCSPSRAAMLTGRYPSRVGVGTTIEKVDRRAMPLAERTIAEVVAQAPRPWRTVALGKWHLSSRDGEGGDDHPNRQGFARYAGLLGNVAVGGSLLRPVGWDDFLKTVDGSSERHHAFVLTDEIDDAIDATAGSEPFLVWLGLHAAHTPFPVPPPHLQPDVPIGAWSADWEKHHAMIGAMDRELGRLFASMDPGVLARTLVIFVGDNGTPEQATLPPFNPAHAKGTLFEEGVRVPLLVAGPGVRPGVAPGFAHVVDLFPTIAELAGVDPAKFTDDRGQPVVIDGRSLWPQLRDPTTPGRDVVYSEKFHPNGPPPWRKHAGMLRDDRFKVITETDGPTWIVDLTAPRGEWVATDPARLSPEDAAHVDRLRARLAATVAAVQSGAPAP